MNSKIKHINTLVLCSALIISPAVLSGCQVARGERSISQYSSDSKITSQVKYHLANSNDVSSVRIHVETDKGIVLLSGFVPTDKEKSKAARIAKRVPGVKKVENKLVVNG